MDGVGMGISVSYLKNPDYLAMARYLENQGLLLDCDFSFKIN